LQIDAGESLKKARRFKKDDTKPKAANKSSEGKISSFFKPYSLQDEAKECTT
jgi:hypothetical protein